MISRKTENITGDDVTGIYFTEKKPHTCKTL